jgi:uncharacterized protein
MLKDQTFMTLELAIEYAEKNIVKEEVKSAEANLSRNRIIIFLLLLLIVPIVWYYSQSNKVKEVSKPSFDCLKAKTSTELKICTEPYLGKLDIENADLYKKAKEIEPLQTKQILKDSTKKRNNCNGEYKCIVSNYEQSINEYKSLINGNSISTNQNQTNNQSKLNPYTEKKCYDCGYQVIILVDSGSLNEVQSSIDKLLQGGILESLPERNRYLEKFQAYDQKWRIDIGRFNNPIDAETFATKLKIFTP